MYFTKTLLEKIRRVYNSCLFNLLGMDLHGKSAVEQIAMLEPYNLLPFYCRMFYRLSLFSYKILRDQILPSIKADLKVSNPNFLNLRQTVDRNIFEVPLCRTIKHSRRLSCLLPKFCNKILRYSYYYKLSDFKTWLLTYMPLHTVKFEHFFINDN